MLRWSRAGERFAAVPGFIRHLSVRLPGLQFHPVLLLVAALPEDDLVIQFGFFRQPDLGLKLHSLKVVQGGISRL